jgi:cytochrome c oxidase subunit II
MARRAPEATEADTDAIRVLPHMPPALRHVRATLLLMLAVCITAVVGFTLATADARDTSGTGLPSATAVAGQDTAGPQPREWHIVARKFAYSVPRIEVQQGDLVKITLDTTDIPHSFTIDEPYRLAKRARPGHPVVFEFRADKAGTFDFYCSLKIDEGCRNMKGQLVVKPRR